MPGVQRAPQDIRLEAIAIRLEGIAVRSAIRLSYVLTQTLIGISKQHEREQLLPLQTGCGAGQKAKVNYGLDEALPCKVTGRCLSASLIEAFTPGVLE